MKKLIVYVKTTPVGNPPKQTESPFSTHKSTRGNREGTRLAVGDQNETRTCGLNELPKITWDRDINRRPPTGRDAQSSELPHSHIATQPHGHIVT